jgi:amino-acid N-acetyltransferase
MILKLKRHELKLTLSQVAKKIGVDVGNLSKIEQGKLLPATNVLIKLADFYNISTDSILNKKDKNENFISHFRSAAPYIHTYSNKIFVIAFDGHSLTDSQFNSIATDINLLHGLNIKIVLVHGIRPFIDKRLSKNKFKCSFVNNQRVTSKKMIPDVIETNGLVRTKIEAFLSSNIYQNNIAKSELKISSGNFIMARPAGVINGIDMENTGIIREVNSNAIQEKISQNEIVIISPIGYSPVGEIFNLPYEATASEIARSIGADKLIYYIEQNGIQNKRGEYLPELTLKKSQNLLSHLKTNNDKKFITENLINILNSANQAIQSGIKKVHLINRNLEGSILQELFTNKGSGSIITEDNLEVFRKAKKEDAKFIEKITKPLAEKNILVDRTLLDIENEIDNFYVLEFDQRIIGCLNIKNFKHEAEIGCFAINNNYQNQGYGAKLLNYAEIECLKMNIERCFILTTQSEHWFIENGYKNTDVEMLPEEKRERYQLSRNSKILFKSLKI